jgi:hypothetical protein
MGEEIDDEKGEVREVVCWGGRRRDENGDGWWGGKHSASPMAVCTGKNQGMG